jgi:hypothetical protein
LRLGSGLRLGILFLDLNVKYRYQHLTLPLTITLILTCVEIIGPQRLKGPPCPEKDLLEKWKRIAPGEVGLGLGLGLGLDARLTKLFGPLSQHLWLTFNFNPNSNPNSNPNLKSL